MELRFESEKENRKIVSSSLSARKTRLLFEEFLQTDFNGSFYHPNLVSFDIALENGLRQAREKSQPALTGKLKNSFLNRFHALASFLRKKPYAFWLLADKSREIVNREFFERQTINSTQYGGRFGLRNNFLPAGFSFNSGTKTIDRAVRPRQDFQDDELSFNLSNTSAAAGQTYFDALQDKFSRTESGAPEQSGTARNFNLSNLKSLSAGKGKRKELISFLSFYDLSGTSKSSVLNLNENLNLEHADFLSTLYNYNFSHKSSSGASATDNKATITLRHRLYESLNTSLGAYYFSSNGNTFSQGAYGFSLEEDYVKRLGKIGRISSGFTLAYSQERRKAPGGVISVIDESHTLTTGTITFLDRPRVDTATVVVTNLAGTTTYTLDIDYRLTGSGERTQIQRIPAGSIANQEKVLVDYQARESPSFNFNTVDENFRARVDFLKDLVGIFYRLTRERHPQVSGEENTVLQTLNDTVAGIELRYKNFEMGLEYENYDSNLSPYKQLKIREGISLNPTRRSTLALQASQSQIRLLRPADTQKYFDFLSRYSASLNRYSRFNTEAGFRWQQGTGVDLNDFSVSSGLEVNFDAFSLDVKYDFKKQLYLGDKLTDHFFSTRVKRRF